MTGDRKKDRKNKQKLETAEAAVQAAEASEPKPKLRRKEFEKELEPLQVELVKMQEWVKASGAKNLRALRGARCSPAKGASSSVSPSAPARAYSAWLRCRRRPSGRSRRCISSATCRICRQAAKSCSSIGAGTTGRASNG